MYILIIDVGADPILHGVLDCVVMANVALHGVLARGRDCGETRGRG